MIWNEGGNLRYNSSLNLRAFIAPSQGESYTYKSSPLITNFCFLISSSKTLFGIFKAEQILLASEVIPLKWKLNSFLKAVSS